MAVFSGCFSCNGDKQLHAWHLDRYRNNNLGRYVNGLIYSDGGDESCTRPNISGIIPSCLNDQPSWKFFAIGSDCGYGINETGNLWGWGRTGASYLGLGNGHYNGCTYPIEIKSCEQDIKWKHVSTCSTHTLAISESGELYAWGKNDYGQLGISNRFPSLALQPRVMLNASIEKINPIGYQFVYPPPSPSSLVVRKNNTYSGNSSDPGSGLEVDVEYSYSFPFVTMTNPGAGYSSTPSIIALFESPIQEIEPVDIIPTMIFSVSGMNIENGGNAYTDNTTIVFSLDNEGNAAIGRCIVSTSGSIENINILYGGKYNSAPTFEIYGNGSGISITPVVTGYIDTITLNGNGNYIQYSGTGLSIVSSGGNPESAAIFDATIFGSVSNFIIRNSGQGYTCSADDPLMFAIERVYNFGFGNYYQYTDIGQCIISGGASDVVEEFTLNERFLISTIPKNNIRLDYGGFYTNGSIIEPFTTNLPLPYLPAYGATLPPTLGLQSDQTEWVTDIMLAVPSASIIFTDGTPSVLLTVSYSSGENEYTASLTESISGVKHGAALKVDYPSYEWKYTEYAMSGHQAIGLYVNPNPMASRYIYLPFERPEGTSSTGSWAVIDTIDNCGSILLLNSQVSIEVPFVTPYATYLVGEGEPEIIVVDFGENYPICTGIRGTLIYATSTGIPYPDGSRDQEKIPNYLLDFSNIVGKTPPYSYIEAIPGYGPNGPVRQNSYPELSLAYEQFGSNMGSGLEISHDFQTIESGDYLYTYLDFNILSGGNNYNEEPQFTITSYPLSPIKIDTSGLIWKEVSVTPNASMGLTESGQLYWWGNVPAQNVWEPKLVGFTTNIDISGSITLNPYGDYLNQYGLKINQNDIINNILPETPGYFNYNADNLPFTISDDIDPGNSYIGGPFDLYALNTNDHGADIANYVPGLINEGGAIYIEEYDDYMPFGAQSFSLFLPTPPYHEGIGSYLNPVTLEIYNTTADFKKTFLCSSNSRLSDPNINLPGVIGYINRPSSFKKIFTSNEGYLCAIDSDNQLWSLSNNFPNINNKGINYDTIGIYAYSGYSKAEWTWPPFVVDGITQSYWDLEMSRICTSDGPYSLIAGGLTFLDTKSWSQTIPGRPNKTILEESSNWEFLGTRFIGNNIMPIIINGGSGYCIDDTFYIEGSGSRLIVSPYNIQRSGYVSTAVRYEQIAASPQYPSWWHDEVDPEDAEIYGLPANFSYQTSDYFLRRRQFMYPFEALQIDLISTTGYPELGSFVAEVSHTYPSYNASVNFNVSCDVKIYNGKIIDIIMPEGFTFESMNVDAYGLGPIKIKSNSGKGDGAHIEFLPVKNTNTFPYKVTQRCESLGITITEDSNRINSCFFADMYDDIYSTYRPDIKLPIYGPSIKKLNGHLAVVYNSGENNLYDFQGITVGNEPPTLNPIINTSFILNNKGKNYSNIIPNITIDQPSDKTAVCDVFIDGKIVSVGIDKGGRGFTSPPNVIFDYNPLGDTAEGEAVIEGPIGNIDLIIPGSGYATAPSIRFNGIGIPAKAVSNINENGIITNIDILDGGLYRTPPTVEFYNTINSGVEASGQCLLDGSVIYISITNSGSMYQYPPQITIRDNNIEEEELRQKLILNEITQKEYDESIYTAIAQCRISGPIDHIDVIVPGRGYSKAFNDIITDTNVFNTTNKLNYDLYKDIFSNYITSNPFNDRLKNYIPSKARIYGLYDAPPWIYGTTSEPLIEVEFDINIANTGCYGEYGSISDSYIINNLTHSQWGVEFTGTFLQKPQAVFLDNINILPHEVSSCKITSYGLRSNQDIVDADSSFLDGYYGGAKTDGSWVYYYRDILRLTNFTDKRIGFGDNESQNYKTYDKLKMSFDHSSDKTFDILDFKFDESYPILFELRDVTGSGALLEVNLDENHKFDGITFLAQGSGYSEKSYLELIQAKTFFEPCEASCRINSEGFIESILILSAGEGYFDNPIIQFSGSQGSGAVAKVILDGGIFPRSVSNIFIENSGSGYDPDPSNPPIISIINSIMFEDTEFFSSINNTLKKTEFLDLFSWSTAQFEYGTYNKYENNLKLLEHKRKAGIYDDISQNIKAPLTRIWDADYYSNATVPVKYMTVQDVLRSDDTSYSYDYENDKDKYIRIMDIFFTFDKIERINTQYTIIRDPYYTEPSAVIVYNSEISPFIQPEIINWDTNITTSHNGTIYAYPSGL